MKRFMRITTFLALSLTTSWASAGLMNYSFSFSDAANGTDVTGIVRGLVDDLAGQQATSVEVLTSTGGFGVGEYAPGFINMWDVLGGIVTSYDFAGLLVGGVSPFPGLGLCFSGCGLGQPVYGLDPDTTDNGIRANSGVVTFDSVPVPATLALFGLGLAGLGWSRRKKA